MGIFSKLPLVRGTKKILGGISGGGGKSSKGSKGKGSSSAGKLKKFETLNRGQKKVLKQFEKKVKPDKIKIPKGAKQGIKFLQNAMQKGPPVSPLEKNAGNFLQRGMQNGPEISPVESIGSGFLQNLLSRSPEDHYQDFAAPYMRQFREQIVPEIAERFTGPNAQKSSAFQQALGGAGAGLAENLASLKGNLINQMLSQQLQGANIGLGYSQMPNQRFRSQLGAADTALGYAQLPAQRWGQQVGIAPSAINAAMMPLQMQQDANRFAQNRQYQQQGQALGTQAFGQMQVPPRQQQPGFWGGALPGMIGTLGGAAIGSMVPGIGTAIGAGIGGMFGRAAGGGTQRITEAPTGPLAGGY